MNRHARRVGRREGCLAAYTADDRPGVHTPDNCDGTCHASEIKIMDDGHGGLKLVLPVWMWLAQEVIPAPPGSDFGLTRADLRYFALMWRDTAARERARLLAPLLRLRRPESGWSAQRIALETRGLLGLRRDSGPPPLTDRVVRCHPRTGPPCWRQASGACV